MRSVGSWYSSDTLFKYLCCATVMTVKRFGSKHFDQNFLKLLKLRVFVSKSIEETDKILGIETVSVKTTLNLSDEVREGIDRIMVNCFDQVNSLDTQKVTLLDTINKNFGGFKGLATIPMWKTHIDVAIAVFNNR